MKSDRENFHIGLTGLFRGFWISRVGLRGLRIVISSNLTEFQQFKCKLKK